jgi:hypothetical protein
MQMTHFALNTKEKMNPTGARASREWQARSAVYVINVSKDFVHSAKDEDGIRRGNGSFATKSLRVYTSYGAADYAVGDRFVIRSSLNHRILCSFQGAEVVGVIDTDGTVTGEIPNRMLPWWVAK